MKYPINQIDYIDIKELPVPDRPRERLTRLGSEALSDIELLMLMLSSGTAKVPVGLAAKRLLELLDTTDSPTAEEIAVVPGIGEAKSKIIAAALELGRRRTVKKGRVISSPSDIYSELRHFANRDQEQFIVAILNGAHEMVSANVITLGLVNRTLVHPREVFSLPIERKAAAIIIAHNHPSGNLTPSKEDEEVTTRLAECGELLGIKVLDHLIITTLDYYSFLEHGKI
jgi:DNA repair protein radc